MNMRSKIVLVVMTVIMIASTLAFAEVRTYRQFKDVATKENGKVTQSTNKGDLFEYTYVVDR